MASTWSEAIESPGNVDEIKVAADLSSRKWDYDFSAQIRRMDKNVLYNIWSVMMEDPGFLLVLSQMRQGPEMSGSQTTVLQERVKNRSKYLMRLTAEIMALFRKQLRINDKFLYQLIINDLIDNILLLLSHPDKFTWQIDPDKRYDVVIIYTIHTCNAKIFQHLVAHVGYNHLLYIYHLAPLDFLPILIQYAPQIPNFRELIEKVHDTFRAPTWKQQELTALLRRKGYLKPATK